MFDLRKRAFSIIIILSVAVFVAHVYVALIQPIYDFVDDRTYLAAAFSILQGTKCPLVAGNSCNYEHPPLSKLLMALGFEIFGKTQVVGPSVGVGANQIGGRFFNMLMGSFSAPVLYLVVNRVSRNWKMAVLSGIFLLVDPLYFTLASTAELDIPMVFFALVALLPLAYESRIGRVNSFVLAGAVLGLSLLSEESAVFIVFAIMGYLLLAGSGNLRARVWSCAELAAAASLVFAIGLELFDVSFTAFPSFLNQLEVILSFHFGAGPGQLSFLVSESNCSQYLGLCPTDKSLIPHFLYSGFPLAQDFSNSCIACWAATNPLDWLTYFPPIIFPEALVMAPNYLLVWLVFAWVPIALWRMDRLWSSSEGKALLLALVVFGWNVASDIWLFVVVGRAVFEWYLLPAIPAMAIGAAYLLTRPEVPRWISYVSIVLVVTVGLLLSPITYHLLFPQSGSCPACAV
jgi:hypothetical protein